MFKPLPSQKEKYSNYDFSKQEEQKEIDNKKYSKKQEINTDAQEYKLKQELYERLEDVNYFDKNIDITQYFEK